MPKRSNAPDAGRRNFLKGATLAGAAALTTPVTANTPISWRAAGPQQGRSPRTEARCRRDDAAAQGPGISVDQRRRFHGRCVQDARHRLSRDELRLELPRSARSGAQSRRQHQAGDPHLPARGNRRSHGAGLRQDRRQADGHDLPRRRRSAARDHGDVQRLVRSRAGHRHGRQHHRGQQARAGRRMGALRHRSRRDRARLRQVGRPADLASAFRRIGGARLQGRDDAADGAGHALARRRAAGKSDRRCRDAAHSEALQGDSAAGRYARRSPNSQRCWSRRKPR